MKVLVTGGAGFIGSHLVDRLVARGDEVVVLDDLCSGAWSNLERHGARIERIEGRVQDLAKHADRLIGVTRIFHLAALISGKDSLDQPHDYFDANINGVLAVVAVARNLPGVRIVFASSSTVYGNTAQGTCRETDVPAPITVYALSKLAGEHLLQMYSAMWGFEAVCLRLFNVYGPRQSPTHPYANVTCKFAHAAATGAGVKLYGDGAQSRDFVYVADVVDALLAVSDRSDRPVYNVGTGRDASIAHLLQTAGEIAGAPLEVERLPPWPNDIRMIRADTERIRAEHGWTARVDLRDGLTRTVEWFKA